MARKTIKIPDFAYARLRELAREEGVSLSRMVARAIATLWLMREDEERQRVALAQAVYQRAITEGDHDSNTGT